MLQVITEVNGVQKTAESYKHSAEMVHTVPYTEAIQKISKAQASDDVDGAKYAKTVNYIMLLTDEMLEL